MAHLLNIPFPKQSGDLEGRIGREAKSAESGSDVINKIKLWPSRNWNLHGVKRIEVTGNVAKITTHCNIQFYQKNSPNSRAGRWLRNKWYVKPCAACGVPDWKIEKYSSTRFKRHQGSMLMDSAPVNKVGTAIS